MAATIQEIAHHLKLSHTTVSRVLNGRQDQFISLATRERIREAARVMNYQPNRVARALVSGRSQVIQFLTNDVHPAYFSRIIQVMKRQFYGTPYEVHVVETHDWTPDDWARGGRSAWPADGIIVLDQRANLQHLLAERQVIAPMVNIGGEASQDVDHVYMDLYAGARVATRHLWEGGRRRIAFLYVASGHQTRLEGYADAMREAGAPTETIPVAWRPGESMRAAARCAVRDMMTAQDHPDALFCYNDEVAIGARVGLRDLGLRVPEDVALAGCDGIEDTEYQDPPLSTLVVPAEEMARLAWEFLQRRIQEPDLPRQSATLAAELAARASSAPRMVS